MSDNNDVFQLVQAQASLSDFNEYLVARRRSLLAQAKALEDQRSGILIEAAYIARATGVKIKRTDDNT